MELIQQTRDHKVQNVTLGEINDKEFTFSANEIH